MKTGASGIVRPVTTSTNKTYISVGIAPEMVPLKYRVRKLARFPLEPKIHAGNGNSQVSCETRKAANNRNMCQYKSLPEQARSPVILAHAH
jgi:hypothetical protein